MDHVIAGPMSGQPPRILIVGGGFAGMYTARQLRRRLRRGEVVVMLVNPRGFMTYQPFLAEAAAGTIEPRYVVTSLRRVLPGTEVLTGRITRIDQRSGIANPHLIINQQTAMETGPVSKVSLTKSFRGQAATLERLRVHRQFDEALTQGPDPLHLASVFGLDPMTAIRYADNADNCSSRRPKNMTPATSPGAGSRSRVGTCGRADPHR